MMKWLRDTYNGVYVVLLKPYMPKARSLILLLLGFLIGLIVAYGVAPTTYYAADPRTLDQSWQDEWVKLLADRNAAANADVSANITELLARIDDPLGTVDRLLSTPGEEANVAKLQAIRTYAEAAQPNAVRAPQPSLWGDLQPWIFGTIILLVLAVVFTLLYGMFIEPNVVQPVMKRLRGEKVSDEVKQMRAQQAAIRAAEAEAKTDFTKTNLGTPIMQRMSSFTLGFGQYDESFEIEDKSERFLGQCGIVISETIGVGSPEKPTAFEVWLFDQADFVRTVTKVYCSEFAYNDPALRSKLEEKGDLVLAAPNSTLICETKSLRLQVRIVDMQYGAGPQPPNSYFEKVTFEIAAWQKDEAGATTASIPATAAYTPVPAAAAPVAAAPAPAAYTPPPAPPMPPSNYAPASYTPAPPPPPPIQERSAPPMPPPPTPMSRPAPPPDDDDPFGGTGDFTPIGQ
jgi:hypothetical protein